MASSVNRLASLYIKHRFSNKEKPKLPPPIKVELQPYDPQWVENAVAEIKVLASVLGRILLDVHHVGSTAIPGIRAKPVLDLMPVVTDLTELDQYQTDLEMLGYDWWGELGLPRRRYCTMTESVTNRRLIQLHCYAEGSPEITRHRAFRDYLRENPRIAAAYDQEKSRCQSLYPDDSHAYGDCKEAWIKKIEAEALARMAW
jgi:GrpB-like predicted nucleotidyltransferase (UPF0157 family)